jgi:hypothetical protein
MRVGRDNVGPLLHVAPHDDVLGQLCMTSSANVLLSYVSSKAHRLERHAHHEF